MDYRIKKRDAFQVVCKRKRVGKPLSAEATPDITAMWQEYGADGTMARLIACLPKRCRMRLLRPTIELSRNSSRRAPSMNMRRMWSLRCILRKM